MKSDFRGVKRALQFMNSSDIEELDDILQVNIAAPRETLYEIGAYIFLEGARFPGNGQIGAPINFNIETVQKMMWIGLELMGAHELQFDVDWSLSDDTEYHAEFVQDSVNKGHWSLHLQYPLGSVTGFDDVSITALDCDADATADIVDNVLILGIPRGCDGLTPTFELGEDYHIHVIIGETDTDLGYIRGEQGEQGIPGNDGADGADGADGTDCDCMGGNPTTTPSAGSASATACNVAMNLCNWLFNKFSDQRDSIAAGIAASKVLVDLVSDFIEEFAQFALVAPIVEGVADFINDISAIGISTVNAADTTEWREHVECELYCYLKGLGDEFTIDSSVVSGWLDTFRDDTDNISGFFARYIEAFPTSALQTRADIYSRIDANCDICTDCPDEHCRIWDFETEAGEFHLLSLGLDGSYSAGNGYVAGHSGSETGLHLACDYSLDITYWKATWESTSSTGSSHVDLERADPTSSPSDWHQVASAGFGTHEVEWGGDGHGYPVVNAYDPNSGSNLTLKTIELHWTGSDPFSTGTEC